MDGKVSGRLSSRNAFPQRSGYAPSPIAGAAEVVCKGEFPVKKIAVRVTVVAGGLIALLLAGGANVSRG
jgi:hypothetical protein